MGVEVCASIISSGRGCFTNHQQNMNWNHSQGEPQPGSSLRTLLACLLHKLLKDLLESTEVATIMEEDSAILDSVTAIWELGMNQSVQLNATAHNASCSWPEKWQWLFTIQPYFLWFLTALGVVENTFVLFVFCLHKSRCTVAEIYLANLAIADLLLLCGLPFWAIYMANNFNWPFGTFLCKAVNTIVYMNFYSSIYFLVMVSIDRYLALVKTMTLGRMRRPLCAKWNCLIIWTSALFLCTPALIFRSLKYMPKYNATRCILNYPPDSHWQVTTNILLNTVGFLMPLCVIIYCTLHIIKALKNNDLQKLKAVQTEKRATTLILVVLLLFIICWLPFQVTTFFDTLLTVKVISSCAANEAIHVSTQIATYCSFSNSCLNPVAYVLVGKHFQKKSKEVYHQLFLRRPSQAPSIQMVSSMDTLRTSISVEWLRKKSIFSGLQ
ncbi:B2 bradykinin receptor [Heteronotia binoei]|uniref:B2 bradykinin receptor n=1 Tax=Heteronotia binoei TaxID=13085 RepID=UPI00293004AF|nr:B2 bradykinin receptor [Heteronotia binoei]